MCYLGTKRFWSACFLSVSSTADCIRPGVGKKSFCATDCKPPNSHPVQSVGLDSHDSLCGVGSRPLPQVPTADSSHPFELEEDACSFEDNDQDQTWPSPVESSTMHCVDQSSQPAAGVTPGENVSS